MTIRLVDEGWNTELTKALDTDTSELRIVCPFIKERALDRLLSFRLDRIQVITRFNQHDFVEGVSDIKALRKLLDSNAYVRGVRNLHAKLYLFGDSRVILTSANLTYAALNKNHEFGMVAEDDEITAACRAYFDDLWRRCGPDLQRDQVDDWEKKVTRHHVLGGRSNQSTGLDDFGVDVGISEPPAVNIPAFIDDETKAFVKFISDTDGRALLSDPIIKAIDDTGCHWAVCYPEKKRPMSVRDNDVIFFAYPTRNPIGIRILGRGIGMRYVEGRDDATQEDIARRNWKQVWPRYIRVHHAEFIAGTMKNGVSFYKLMDTLGSDSFSSTQRNARNCNGNTDPRRAYKNRPAIELSSKGRSWLEERIQAAFNTHGKISPDELEKLLTPA